MKISCCVQLVQPCFSLLDLWESHVHGHKVLGSCLWTPCVCLQVLHSNLEKHVLPYMSDSPSAVPDPTSVGTAMSDAMGDQLVAPELGLLSGGGQAVVKCQVKDCTVMVPKMPSRPDLLKAFFILECEGCRVRRCIYHWPSSFVCLASAVIILSRTIQLCSGDISNREAFLAQAQKASPRTKAWLLELEKTDPEEFLHLLGNFCEKCFSRRFICWSCNMCCVICPYWCRYTVLACSSIPRCPARGRGLPRNKFDFSEIMLVKSESQGHRSTTGTTSKPLDYDAYIKFYTEEAPKWRRFLLTKTFNTTCDCITQNSAWTVNRSYTATLSLQPSMSKDCRRKLLMQSGGRTYWILCRGTFLVEYYLLVARTCGVTLPRSRLTPMTSVVLLPARHLEMKWILRLTGWTAYGQYMNASTWTHKMLTGLVDLRCNRGCPNWHCVQGRQSTLIRCDCVYWLSIWWWRVHHDARLDFLL